MSVGSTDRDGDSAGERLDGDLPRTHASRPRESVWDYPRPPRLEPESRQVRLELGGEVIASTSEALRILETSHPPTIYLPFASFAPGVLRDGNGSSFCEWKGMARYHDLVVGDRVARAAGWSYRRPNGAYAALVDHVAIYPGRVDAAWLDDERVRPQPGDFYGGWITDELDGPFKGAPGTRGW
ncbi:MAG: DUF427 domain-containing protein [Solirubrobacteraceae bacterium]|nr:DUF427 domain-containing protein [Solirubrobacteraceae bacterium]